jgi:DNA-binding transcriptional ArsR family regulator
MVSEQSSWSIRTDEEIQQFIARSKKRLSFLKDDQFLEKKAELFKSLGDATRLKIVGMLLISDLCMCEIVSGLQLPPSTISHHLKILERGKVIHSRREGKFTVYAINTTLNCLSSEPHI